MEEEIQKIEKAILQEKISGTVSEETKHLRVRMGIYSMRKTPGEYVLRIRLPCGIIQPEQLEFIAELVEHYATPPHLLASTPEKEQTNGCGGKGFAHLTTRQGIQIAGISGADVGEVLRRIASAGLTTKNTGGNVVRNIVCCPLSGISQNEIFDVTPYALGCDEWLRDAPEFQELPRKIKISFESCAQDHVRTLVSDIGLCAATQSGKEGFRISVGGGLGAVPMFAETLEDFTPVELLFPTLQAVLAVFNQYGDRKNRAQARLKWLIRSLGIQWFREAVYAERERKNSPLPKGWLQIPRPSDTPFSKGEFADGVFQTYTHSNSSPPRNPTHESYHQWRRYNLRAQKQKGFFSVMVRCLYGDLWPAQLRAIAAAAKNFSSPPHPRSIREGERVRVTIEQNILLRWVEESALPDLYAFLSKEGLSSCCAEQIMDITRCVGAEACVSAITNSAAAARTLTALFSNGLSLAPELRNLRIRVSGCPHGCSHHSLADIGLYGTAKRIYGKLVPHYAIWLCGNSGTEHGWKLIEVPAYRLATAIERVLRFYLHQKLKSETLSDFVKRKDIPALRELLLGLTSVPPPDEAPEFYRDLESERDFLLEAKEGECHA